VSVQGELQKAADAGALAGARALSLIAPAPNWTNGTTVATATVKKNSVNGSLILDCTPVAGYWDRAWTASQKAAANLKPTGTIPSATDVPAIKVTVEKSSGKNGGPLTMLFAKVLGISTGSLKAQAVAAMVTEAGLPVSSIPAGDAFPMATPISWVQTMWKPNANSATFRIGSSYHSPDGGQWTSFLTDANNVPAIRNLIENGNPTPLKIGDEIWIEPGTKTSIYGDAADRIGNTVLLPVVGNDFDTHNDTPILAFVPFHISDAQGGNDKYIEGYFVPSYTVQGATGSATAPNFGAIAYSGSSGGAQVRMVN
jgi:hypothetical protein